MRVVSASAVFGLVCFALSGCGQASYRVVSTAPLAPAPEKESSTAGVCPNCDAPPLHQHPISAHIACGPKLEHRDEATGPVTLARGNTLVYTSALTGKRVEVKGLCEVRFVPTSFAQAAK